MEQVSNLGRKETQKLTLAGLYGLVAAKTYLQVAGVYDQHEQPHDAPDLSNDIPYCFTGSRRSVNDVHGCHLLVLDAGSDIGGTWAEERLYPNLLSQNSYGLYEFSDLPLSDAVPDQHTEAEKQFIPGWKINRYLHRWIKKWGLRKHIKLNWKVRASLYNQRTFFYCD